MEEITTISYVYLDFCHEQHKRSVHCPKEKMEKMNKIMHSLEKRYGKCKSNIQVTIKKSELPHFNFDYETPYRTPQERWDSMDVKTRNWLLKRIENVDKYQVEDWEMEEAPCFFCGKLTNHINNGGDAWAASVKKSNGEMISVLYCNVERHSGPDASRECEESHNNALWYEEGVEDIIGFYGSQYTMYNNPTERLEKI